MNLALARGEKAGESRSESWRNHERARNGRVAGVRWFGRFPQGVRSVFLMRISLRPLAAPASVGVLSGGGRRPRSEAAAARFLARSPALATQFDVERDVISSGRYRACPEPAFVRCAARSRERQNQSHRGLMTDVGVKLPCRYGTALRSDRGRWWFR